MSRARLALLEDRGVISATGDDTTRLLQGLLTADLSPLDRGLAVFGALLTPQGKILCEMFLARAAAGLLIDVDRGSVSALIERLELYRLRAQVSFVDRSEAYAVAAAWNGDIDPSVGLTNTQDPRSPEMGRRLIVQREQILATAPHADLASAADYHAHRIAQGIAEGGKDYDFGDAFPHEANFDLVGGASFDKGCYVGQEIVARMQHRANVRKRVVRVTGEAELPPARPEVRIGDVTIGRLGSVAGCEGLALIRLDRAVAAADAGQAITAGGVNVRIDADMMARQRAQNAARAAAVGP